MSQFKVIMFQCESEAQKKILLEETTFKMVGPYLVQRSKGDDQVWVTYLGASRVQRILGKVKEAKIALQ